MKSKKQLIKNKNLHVIFGITFIAVMGVSSITPALPKISQALELTTAEVGLLISVFTLPGIFLTAVMGVIADRWGRKKVLAPSLFLFAIAGFGSFYFHTFHVLMVLRFFQGIGASSLGSLNTTLVGDFFKGKHRPAAMGYNASVLSLSTALFPLIGGSLAGIAWFYPFILPLFAIPVGLFVIFRLDEPNIIKAPNLSIYFRAVSISISRREVLAIFVLSVCTFIILYGAFLTYLPFLLDQRFGLSSAQIGMVLSLSSLTTAIFATQVGRLTNKFGSLPLLKMAFVLYLLINVLVPNIQNIIFFIIPVLLFGTAQALNIPSLQTILANLAPDQQRGVFMSLNGMVLRIGQTLGPLIIGIGYTVGDIKGAYYLAAGVALFCLLILYGLLNNERINKTAQ